MRRRPEGPIDLLTPLDEVMDRALGAVARSPADETSVAWIESWRRRTGPVHQEEAVIPERNVLVRVLEGGRLGVFRSGGTSPAELDRAVRMAMAHARGERPLPGFPHLPADTSPLPALGDLHDPDVAALEPATAARRLAAAGAAARRSRLDWGEAQLAVTSSKGAPRGARLTRVALEAGWEAEGSGWAATAARRLADLPFEPTVERARRRAADGERRTLASQGATVAIAPEVAAHLLDVVNRRAFTAQAYQSGESFLREFLGHQVFDRGLDLMDDATSGPLPFPFDLEGTAKRPVALVAAGTPRTPALDQRHAALAGLPPTPHASAADDARAEHLSLLPGELGEEELLAEAGDGVWIGKLERVECYNPRRLQIRAVVRGARRLRDGRLGEALTPMIWEVSLLQALARVRLGNDPQTVADGSTLVGSITSPTLLLVESGHLEPL